MDTQLYVSILREHSEHLSRLATTLSAKLTQLEHSLNKQGGSPSPDTVTFVEGVAKLQGRLFTETELFCRRLQVFLEMSETTPATPEPHTAEQPHG
jgi:hypothetical protein